MNIGKIRAALGAICLCAGLGNPASASVLTFTQAYGTDLLTVSVAVTDLNNDGWIRATAYGGEVLALTMSWTGPSSFVDATPTGFGFVRFSYFMNGGALGDDAGEHFEMLVQSPSAALVQVNPFDVNVPNKVCDSTRCGSVQVTGAIVDTAELLQPVSVPEPSTFALVGLGLAAATGLRRRRLPAAGFRPVRRT